MFSQDRNRMRQFFVDAWRKQRRGEPMQPLEILVAQVIADHPEYHPLLEQIEPDLSHDFSAATGESNPFLHLGMHISVREQLSIDRPAGIRNIYQRLSMSTDDAHASEHQVMACLEKILWEAQAAGRAPDDQAYLECLQRLLDRR